MNRSRAFTSRLVFNICTESGHFTFLAVQIVSGSERWIILCSRLQRLVGVEGLDPVGEVILENGLGEEARPCCSSLRHQKHRYRHDRSGVQHPGMAMRSAFHDVARTQQSAYPVTAPQYTKNVNSIHWRTKALQTDVPNVFILSRINVVISKGKCRLTSLRLHRFGKF